jgi:hypothetical protein
MKERSRHTLSTRHPLVPRTPLPPLSQTHILLDPLVAREVEIVRLEKVHEAADLGAMAA